ncbi:MAG: hypothetical protein KJN90_02115 [Gammaproteobacteria bacterium]|nr:hypothetical protein [Gammaproteobacteria bacterium]
MTQIKILTILLALFLLASCASSLDMTRPVSDFYCDNFLIYEMCAQDLNKDGEVELVFFTDTNEVFLYRGGTEPVLPGALSMHRCAQPMNEDIVRNTSRLFYISDDTTYLERSDIRGSLMISYVSFLPRVAGCSETQQVVSDQPADEFDFEFEF